MKKSIAFLMLCLSALAFAKPSKAQETTFASYGDHKGNILKDQLDAKLSQMQECEEKEAVMDAILDRDNEKLKALVGIELPFHPNQKHKRMEKFKVQSLGLECKKRIKMMEHLLQNEIALKDLGLMAPDAKPVHVQLSDIMDDLECVPKIELIEAIMDLDKEKVKLLTGLDLPLPDGRLVRQRKYEANQFIKEQTIGLSCEDKEEIYDAYFHHQVQKLHDMGIELKRPPRHEEF